MPLAERRRRSLIAGGVAFAVGLAGLVVFLIVVVLHASTQIAALTGDRSMQAAQIQGLAGAIDSARAQIKGLGATPVVPAPSEILETVSVPGPPGPQGLPGQGASDAQVSQAVAIYLAVHPVPGVSDQQITAAVDAYFAATPPPSGPQGPGPSDQQIAVAVASYMAANPAPSGPAGPPGEAGSPGQDGSPPAGWSWTDPSGVSYTCLENGQTPAPNYACSEVPSSSPSASPSGAVAGAAAITSTRTAGASPAASHRHTRKPTPHRSTSAFAWLIGVPFYRRDWNIATLPAYFTCCQVSLVNTAFIAV